MLSRVLLAVLLAVMCVGAASARFDTGLSRVQGLESKYDVDPSYASAALLSLQADIPRSTLEELMTRQVSAADDCGPASCADLYHNAKRQCANGAPPATCNPESAPGAAAACKWYKKGYTDGGCAMSIAGTSVPHRVPMTIVTLDQYGSILDMASLEHSVEPSDGFDASQGWIGDAIGRARRSINRAKPIPTLDCTTRWADVIACISSGGGSACLATVPTDDVCYQWLEKSI